MRQIWKFPIALQEETILEMPVNSEILDVQMQGQTMVLWAMVDPRYRMVKKRISILGTGQDVPDDFSEKYIASVQDGEFVWHVFDGGGA